MRFDNLGAILLVASVFGQIGCGTKTPTAAAVPSSELPNGASLAVQTGDNILPLTVNGTLCSNGSYTNKPCVSVKVCETGTAHCQVINDVLLDTGSYGLRLFKPVLTVATQPILTTGSSQLAECVTYGDGSSDWGTVETADVVLGGENAVTVPIQVIDSTYATVPAHCGTPETSAANAGFNGILGVGLFVYDCGAACVGNGHANNGAYYSCAGSTCTGSTVALAHQVRNPVSALTQDNNGVILELPTVGPAGSTSASGYLVLGIGTRSNNIPGGVTRFDADATTGNFQTSFGGQTYQHSFIDSGSNGLFIPNPATVALPDCGTTNASAAGWFCPTGNPSFSATTTAASGSPASSVEFQVGNMLTLSSSSNKVFNNLAGDGGTTFDWGLPFFLGRNVYVGFENSTTSLGAGPFWAY